MTERTVYLAGAGFIAHHHARAAASLPNGVAVSAADPSPAAREEFNAEFPHADLYEDVKEMLDAPASENDIVVVAAPPFARRDLAMAAIESGRHVLCEKPLAMNVREAEELLAAGRNRDLVIGSAAGRFLGDGHTDAVRAAVREQALGDPYHATWVDRSRRSRTGIEHQPESHWPLDASRAGGGVLMNWGCYDLATLNHVLDPERVDVLAAWTATPETGHDLPEDVTNDVEQHAGAALRYHRPDGSTVAVTYERADCTHGAERTVFEIEGTAGAIRWDWKAFGDDAPGLTRCFDEDNEPREEERTYDPCPHPIHHRPLVFFDRAIRGETAPIPTDERAVFNFACVRALYDVAETGDPRTVRLEER